MVAKTVTGYLHIFNHEINGIRADLNHVTVVLTAHTLDVWNPLIEWSIISVKDTLKACWPKVDDSVAHELTHFVQAKYQNFDLNDESLEWDAIDVQNWFRENFCKP